MSAKGHSDELNIIALGIAVETPLQPLGCEEL